MRTRMFQATSSPFSVSTLQSVGAYSRCFESQMQRRPGRICMTSTMGTKFFCHSTIQANVEKQLFTPPSAPLRESDVRLLQQFIQASRRLVVLTGAGVSTECGIPDYRSPNGAYSMGYKPMFHQEFLRSERNRRRYWVRSYAGWQRFISAQPGPTHRRLAQLESRGCVQGIITQNVDRLHHAAGSIPVELHGTTHEVVCLDCGDVKSRHDFQEKLKELNPEWAVAVEAMEKGESALNFGMQRRPDGDVDIDEGFWEGKFFIPQCEHCGGTLKPNVVFFGDNIPKLRSEKAMLMISNADALLVVGSSLMVLSAFRLVKGAHDKGLPLAIVNIGSTRADSLATIKIECRSGELLSSVLDGGYLRALDCDRKEARLSDFLDFKY